MTEFGRCPICDAVLDYDDPDILYPTGVYWLFNGKYHRYCSIDGISLSGIAGNPCYKAVCDECGAEMHGDSRQEVIEMLK